MEITLATVQRYCKNIYALRFMRLWSVCTAVAHHNKTKWLLRYDMATIFLFDFFRVFCLLFHILNSYLTHNYDSEYSEILVAFLGRFLLFFFWWLNIKCADSLKKNPDKKQPQNFHRISKVVALLTNITSITCLAYVGEIIVYFVIFRAVIYSAREVKWKQCSLHV